MLLGQFAYSCHIFGSLDKLSFCLLPMHSLTQPPTYSRSRWFIPPWRLSILPSVSTWRLPRDQCCYLQHLPAYMSWCAEGIDYSQNIQNRANRGDLREIISNLSYYKKIKVCKSCNRKGNYYKRTSESALKCKTELYRKSYSFD